MMPSVNAGRVSTIEAMIGQLKLILSQHLYSLGKDEREKAYYDVHAVPRDIEETPTFVQQSLQMLQTSIAAIPEKKAYNLAELLGREYVHDINFRLKFLRGEHFDAKLAAEKIVRHFQFKFDLFGRSKLAKDIYQEDLELADKHALYSGFLQGLPMKDTAGRSLHIAFPGGKVKSISLVSKLRVLFYLRMVALEDVEVQRRGLGVIISTADIESGLEDDALKMKRCLEKWADAFEALPGTFMAVHIVLFHNLNTMNGYMFVSLIQLIVLVMKPFFKVRLRMHQAFSRDECLSNLTSFGIPIHWIPRSTEDNTAFHTMLMKRKELESIRSSSGIAYSLATNSIKGTICVPSPFDVILGRGRPLMDHQGNLILRNLIIQYRDEYEAISRCNKKAVSTKVIDAIKQFGRFIKEEDFGWVEVNDDVARLKVSLKRPVCIFTTIFFPACTVLTAVKLYAIVFGIHKKVSHAFRDFIRRQDAKKKGKKSDDKFDGGGFSSIPS